MTPEALAVVAHELRSPVAALVAIAETFEARAADLSDEQARRLLELAVAACRNVERLVADTALFSLEEGDVDLDRLVSDTAARAGLANGAVAVRAVRSPPLPQVRGDRLRLQQLLDNLVANAVAHSLPGDEVVVSAESVGERVLVSVADSGEGIAGEDLARIFDPGVRLTERPGSGLGLYVARTIAEAHGGALEVVSTPGEGATFTLVLPLASAASR